MEQKSNVIPALDYLRKHIDNTLAEDDQTHYRYPTPISRTLGMRIVEVGAGTAAVEIDADPLVHGNQQGTVHGGLLSELADAAIGTAHSTLTAPDESFTSIDLKIHFFRPVWKCTLRAIARAVKAGRTISYYGCEIQRDDGAIVAMAAGTVMTLRGEKARGR